MPGFAARFAGNLLIHPLSRLLPRDSGLWAFGAPSGRFEGNSKYLFLWLSRNRPDANIVWISPNRALVRMLRARGYRAAWSASAQGAIYAARAGLYCVNDGASDIHFSLSGGATLFNLWHGVGLKNVQRGAKIGYGARLREGSRNPIRAIRVMRRFQRPDLILSTSTATAEHFARCFDVPVSKAPVLGYPRLDPMVDPELKRLAMSFEDYSGIIRLRETFEKLFLYAPTLRITDAGLLAEAIPSPARLSIALRSQNAVLALKLHPKTSVQQGWTDALPDNIVMLPPGLDIYPILDIFDLLITDYSSLLYDFIFFKVAGVLVYPFDFERYLARDRDLACDYDSSVVGSRADDFDALCSAIETGEALAPLAPDKLAELRHRFWGGEAPSRTSSEQIADFVQWNLPVAGDGAPR